ncbi:sialin-like isoform X1 [Bolinopsis microptera]|uniref:sialin-like isoform X1 n=1 Tax=Bolinopsis microptera TaxID=2820187 RepID=UPI003079D54E
MWDWFRTRRRYIAYLCLLCNAYTEMCARFGVSISMIGGMVKKDCDDPDDVGQFCWSQSTQAMVIGAYFYGYVAQCFTTFVAKYFTGFTRTYRFWLILSGAIQFCYPTFAALSPTIVIFTQAIRGVVAGIMMSFSFHYISKFGIGKESKIFISLVGATNYIGSGTGGVLAGFITDIFGWQYYFYYSGICYAIGLVLTLLFVQESPEKCWFMTLEEKDMIMKENKPSLKSESHEPSSPTNKLSFCRLYLIAFSIYLLAYNIVIYGILSVMPFYLNEITGADPQLISYLNISLTLLIALCTIAFSYVVQILDTLCSWLVCRMMCTLIPMLSYIIFFIALSYHLSFIGATIILISTSIMASTLFGGSVFMINYEMDPKNSAVRMSIFNSVGQAAGFICPLLMAAITTTDRDHPNYASVYRQKWSYFFYTVAGFAAAGCLVIMLAYILSPDEWVNKDRKICKETV